MPNRKIIVSEMVSVDGYFSGPNGELDWHNVNAEFNDAYAVPMLEAADTLMFGFVTYELMASYWPTTAALKDDPIVASKMNEMRKIVFSNKPQTLAWNNSSLKTKIVAEDIVKLKQSPGKDILIFGSGMIVSELTRLGLIDEYRFMVNPIILGNGKPLLTNIKDKIKLNLLETKKFKSGNVLLRYEPKN